MSGSPSHQLDYDVIVVGHLVNADFAIAEALIRQGLRCAVVRFEKDIPNDFSDIPGACRDLDAADVLPFKNPFWFFCLCLKSKAVVSITGNIIAYLFWCLPLMALPFFPPVFNITTGSDITEEARKNTVYGYVYRWLLRRTHGNWISSTPEAVKTAVDLRVKSPLYFRFPMFDRQIEGRTRENSGDDIVYFHPARLDWGGEDKGPYRNSTKGSDRFLRAFNRALSEGANVRCLLLDRGADRELAKELIGRGGFSSKYTWMEPTSQAGLAECFTQADVVVDQFDVGFFGWIACEAMLHERPVMAYADEACSRLVYDQEPPIINCQSEDDIYKQIMRWSDRAQLTTLGLKSREWARKNHFSDKDMPLFAHKICVAAGLSWPRK
ncbi:hypothetical protein [Kiloniella sp.]|uniref:hypothetical protein n=1 Tax=Kiloniella sp. TaxID=1938587 RepID=UPI003A8F704E